MNHPIRLHPILYRLCIAPHGEGADARRREFILNVLLSGLLLASLLALVYSAVNYFVLGLGDRISTVVQTMIFCLLILGLLVMSRRSRPNIAAGVFIVFLVFTGAQFVLAWGADLAIAELVLVLSIVIAGVLFTARSALMATGLISSILLLLVWLQASGMQQPSRYWKEQPFQVEDTVGYIIIFVVIGLVSWLSNRETDRALQRARSSEAALQTERDNLEQKVIQRTHQLEELQLSRLLEMQPMADIGLISASLVHDIANPLAAAMMQIEELSRQDRSRLSRQVKTSLQQVDRYLGAARKQIRRQSEIKRFSVGHELRQVVHLLRHRARQANVTLLIEASPTTWLHGDPVRFSQLTANLITNAIDAYQVHQGDTDHTVKIRFGKGDGGVTVSVVDRAGGIKKQDQKRLFEPFYSTKSSVRQGLGIGLVLVKQYVEDDFSGSITIDSTVGMGTNFTVRLRNRKRA